MTPDPRRWRQLALLATAMVLAMSVWLAASAVIPVLAATLSLTPSQSAWLQSAVQLGFVAGTLVAAILNLADIFPGRWYFAIAACVAAIANAGLLIADGFGVALATRFVTGVALAGVYPPAMKMAATWFQSGRGLAIGTVVGALTAGKSLPFFIEGLGHPSLTLSVMLPSCGALLAAVLIAAGYRDGPHQFPSRPFSWGLAGAALSVPEVRRATGGYLGHMWELYAFWTWVTGFIAASISESGRDPGTAAAWGALAIGIGAFGAVWGGIAADRLGRPKVVRLALIVSGICCLLSPIAFSGPRVLLLVLVMVWGIAVIADSAQFSAMVTEHAPPHAVGTALTLQTSMGFLLTIATIQGVPAVAEMIGWRWAMVGLAMGPVAGIYAMRKLGKQEKRERGEGGREKGDVYSS